MKRKTVRSAALVAGIVATGALAANAPAQTNPNDSLLNKLVDKGILTPKEAQELRAEASPESKGNSARSMGMPDWVTSLKLYGDFRGRVEDFWADNPAYTTRTRYRYRLRLGTTITLKDDFEVGVRLSSGDPSSTVGGNPVSANTTLQGGSSRKFVWLEQAYAKWTPIHTADWTASATIGKMDSPFEISNMVIDYDYQPEGAALQAAYKVTDRNTLKVNGGIFALNELNQGADASHDPYFAGAQALWNAKWTPKIESTLGVSAFTLGSKENLNTGAALPNVNVGNTRDGLGNLLSSYNPIIGSASVTYKLRDFSLFFYPGAIDFPIRVGGEYMENPAARSANKGFWAGVTFGKATKQRTWELNYKYQKLDSDAWYEEIVDEDNGAFYQTAPLGGAAGWAGGTNVKGHVFKAIYALTDSLQFIVSAYHNELIHPNPPGSQSAANHLMVDLLWKF